MGKGFRSLALGLILIASARVEAVTFVDAPGDEPAASVLAAPDPAAALAPAFRWKADRVSYLVVPDQYLDMATRVLADWNECGILRLRLARVKESPDVRATVADYGYTPTWVGITSCSVDPKSGVARLCTIAVNTWWLDRDWLGKDQGVLCHEVGHSLGLGHGVDPDSCLTVGVPTMHHAASDCVRLGG